MINHTDAPCIVSSNDSEKVGAVLRSKALARPEDQENALFRTLIGNANASVREKAPFTADERYEMAGLGNDVQDVFNTGVMVLKPHHQRLLKEVYQEYEANEFSKKENLPLAYHFLKNDAVNHIDTRFNKIFDRIAIQHYPFLFGTGVPIDQRLLAAIVNIALYNSYFLHFIAGLTRKYINLAIPGQTLWDALKICFERIEEETHMIGGDVEQRES
jgi:hypothetical protein